MLFAAQSYAQGVLSVHGKIHEPDRPLQLKPGKEKIWASVVVEIDKDKNGNPISARLSLSGTGIDHTSGCLLSMDTLLIEEEIIRINGNRWDIEVFFKMTKSHLNLAKELQGPAQLFQGSATIFRVGKLSY